MAPPREKDRDFSHLSPYQPRRFVPQDADLTDPEQAVALFKALLDRPVHSPEELETWLLDRSELEAVLGQTGSVLRIRMTCQTDDKEKAEAFKKFIEQVPPAVKPLDDKLDRKYLEARDKHPLDARRYEVYDRAARADVELFREENVPLQTQDALLCQEYQTVCGAMTVEFLGEERTLPQMAKFLLDPDRGLRRDAWKATAARRLLDRDKFEEIFGKMLEVRGKIAANAGCADYRDFMFKAYHRFDYSPQDCFAYHEAVEKVVVPVWRDILLRRRERMELPSLRPWDLEVDPEGRPPLQPFEKAEELVRGVGGIFRRLDPVLGGQFAEMDRLGLLDLESRKGKAPGGYQTSLSEARKPFIFMNAVGLDQDVRTLLHEGGHAFHTLAAADEPLEDYRHAPIEFCEVASMSLELLAEDHLSVFYEDEGDRRRSALEHLEDVVFILPWVATVDAFQHWVYEHPGHGPDERRKAWLEISDRFGGGVVDWSGLMPQRSYAWHRQLHIFEVPFYYIEYAIAQLGALQLWARAKRDHKGTLAAYRRALALGGSRPLPELFAAAGLEFDFSEGAIAPLMELVGGEIAGLSG